MDHKRGSCHKGVSDIKIQAMIGHILWTFQSLRREDYCKAQISIIVEKDYFATLWLLRLPCYENYSARITVVMKGRWIILANCEHRELEDMRYHKTADQKMPIMVSQNNQLRLFPQGPFEEKIELAFKGVASKSLRVVYDDPISNRFLSGKVFPPGYDLGLLYPPLYTGIFILQKIFEYNLFLSFNRFQVGVDTEESIAGNFEKHDSLHLFEERPRMNIWKHSWTKCSPQYIASSIHKHSIKLHFETNIFPGFVGFEMRFSYLSVNSSIKGTHSGLFDCTGADRSVVFRHLHCNLHVECLGGEDEPENCSYHDQSQITCEKGQKRMGVRICKKKVANVRIL